MPQFFLPWTEERNPRMGGPSGLATPIFSLSSLEPKSLRMVILTIILVQVLCCLYQNIILKYGMRGHFRYNLPIFGDWWQHNQSKQDELQEYQIDTNLKS